VRCHGFIEKIIYKKNIICRKIVVIHNIFKEKAIKILNQLNIKKKINKDNFEKIIKKTKLRNTVAIYSVS
jgi:hypothetical protein